MLYCGMYTFLNKLLQLHAVFVYQREENFLIDVGEHSYAYCGGNIE